MSSDTTFQPSGDARNFGTPLTTEGHLSLISGLWPNSSPVEREKQGNNSQYMIHSLLFMLEYSSSGGPARQATKRCLGFFFGRHGGLHLLLMLLNAHYNKPPAGRRPGWVFSTLRDRLQMSERALRMLIHDAIASGLIEQQSITNELDKRCRSYRLTPPVVEAWEELMSTMHGSVGEVVRHFTPGELANADYRRWDPGKPAREQAERLPPSHRLRLKR